MDIKCAQQFADSWIEAFNNHDMQRILAHYAESVLFTSPLIMSLGYNTTGIIHGKPNLRNYFERGLQVYPALHFTQHACFGGVNTLVIYYTSVNNKLAAETFELDETGKATRVWCHYTS